MNKKQSKEAKFNLFEEFSVAQVAIAAVVLTLIIVAVVSGVKAFAPPPGEMSNSDVAAHETAKNNNPNLGYVSSPNQPAAQQAQSYH
jgi:uncharacterized protein (UPF0333 family)